MNGMGAGGRSAPWGHEPVMLDRVLFHLDPRPGVGPGGGPRLYVDGTIGAGGHAEAILERASPDGRLIGVDRDRPALDVAAARLLPRFGDRVTLVHGDFADLPEILARVGQHAADGLLLDLGVSSMQLDDPSRGFSLRADGPLDMRMDPDAGVRAGDILDALSEADLAGALRGFGGERMAGRVARAINERRRSGRLRTTFDLRDAVHGAIGRRRTGRIDAATRAFQTLRILTNREMESLDAILDRFARILRPGGRAVFISFHSEEDGRVKRALRALAANREPRAAAGSAPVPRVAILTRKPERPSSRESASNPRARSARLRAAERVAEAA